MKQTMSNMPKLINQITVLLTIVSSLILSKVVYSENLNVELTKDHPTQYSVVKGDTLWGISAKFLDKPWQWPEIWEINPQVKNPHLIYPGDIVYLEFVNGRPVLRRKKSNERPTYKLSPNKRIKKLDLAIPTIRLEELAPFLIENRMVDANTLANAPYILDTAEEHLIAATNYSVYVQGIPAQSQTVRYGIYRQGRTLTDPNDKEKVLAYEAVYLGEGDIVRAAESKDQVSTLRINKSRAEILNGARLLPLNNDNYNSNFMPKAAQTAKVGNIIAQLSSGVSPSLTHVAANDVAIINFGKADNIEVGDVFHVYRKGRVMNDPYYKHKTTSNSDSSNMNAFFRNKEKLVKLPHELIADLLVFRTFDNVSYATIMDSTTEVRLDDIVVSPYMKQY